MDFWLLTPNQVQIASIFLGVTNCYCMPINLSPLLNQNGILNFFIRNASQNIKEQQQLISTFNNQFIKQNHSMNNSKGSKKSLKAPKLNKKKFITKERLNLTKQVLKTSQKNIKAQVLPPTQEYLPMAGQLIRNGELVAFPTETVYGLGADATCEKALLDIYRVKKRPLTDPIIVHVLGYEDALKLVQIESQAQEQIFKTLATYFWPGPLTMILKANLEILPKVVTAQTGFVGIRSPKGQYARKLLEESKRPIGAPSANLFSHVSPTSPSHVFNDFYDQNVTIIDGNRCQYGIQSTVVKIVENRVEILRQGSLSSSNLMSFIKEHIGDMVEVKIMKKVQDKKANENMEAPGQLLKHYAPYLPCYFTTNTKFDGCEYITHLEEGHKINLKDTAMISFSQQFNHLSHKLKYYFEVASQSKEEQNEMDEKFCSSEQKSKMKQVYHLLRKCENLDVQCIVIGWGDDKTGTIWDKIFRSTQGNEAIFS